MPTRHGLFQEEGKPLKMQLGILGTVWLMSDSVFEKISQADKSVDDDTHLLRVNFAQGQRLHMHEVASRLLDSLDMFRKIWMNSEHASILRSQ